MPYPRQLVLGEEKEAELGSLLRQELDNHYAERGDWVQNLMDWQRDYWVEPSTERRTFPFLGASNIIVPLNAIAVEAVFAREFQTAFALKPFVFAKARVGDLIRVEQPFENWTHYMILERMNGKQHFSWMMLERLKFGTTAGKSSYVKIVRKAVRPVGDSNIEEEIPVVVKDGPTLDAVPVANLLMRFNDKDPQTALWVGEEHSSSLFEIELGVRNKLFREGTTEKLGNTFMSTESGDQRQFERKQEELEQKEPVWTNRVSWQEIWMAFDVDGDGEQEEIQVLYHKDSRTIMSVRYNWHTDLRRPYRTAVYIPVEHRWTGVGIGKQNEQFQREITTIHRQRLDNATLANMRMYKVHKLSGYGPREPVFPGKMWFLDDLSHVEAFQMGEIYQSSFANEQGALLYSQQRTGVSEVLLGIPQAGTPGTATSDLARIQEGNKKFDAAFSNMRDLMSELTMDVIMNVSQFGTRLSRYFDLVEGGRLVSDILFSENADLLREGMLLEIAAASQQGNRIADRQNWQQVAVMLQQYYVGMSQLAAGTGDKQIQQVIFSKGLRAITEVMRQILESFNIRNVDRIIVSEIEEAVNAGAAPGAVPVGGGNAGGQGNGQTPGLADILQILSRTGAPGLPPAR